MSGEPGGSGVSGPGPGPAAPGTGVLAGTLAAGGCCACTAKPAISNVPTVPASKRPRRTAMRDNIGVLPCVGAAFRIRRSSQAAETPARGAIAISLRYPFSEFQELLSGET